MNTGISAIVNDLNRPFWDGAARGELVLPHCTVTGRAFWPPAPISPYSDGSDVEWRSVDGRGVVRAVAIYRRGFLKAFEPLLPYGVALVELECGVRLQAHVGDVEVVSAGDTVKLAFKVLVAGERPVPLVERRK